MASNQRKIDWDLVGELFKDGYSVENVAWKYHISRQSLYNRFKKDHPNEKIADFRKNNWNVTREDIFAVHVKESAIPANFTERKLFLMNFCNMAEKKEVKSEIDLKTLMAEQDKLLETEGQDNMFDSIEESEVVDV
ncbi:MAG: hypothetical protein ACTSWK_07265 [Promethearchaeota archaeon]